MKIYIFPFLEMTLIDLAHPDGNRPDGVETHIKRKRSV